MFEFDSPSKIEPLHSPLFVDKEVSVFIKREDQIHPEISGNKWRKLKYNFIESQAHGFRRILTFGGAFSNHIAATAAAAKKYGFESIGIIRGDELNENSNPTLKKASVDGMQLVFISRTEYKNRNDPNWSNSLAEKHQAYLIPEGGSNELALVGVREMVDEIPIPFDFLICPVGTGGTLAGAISALQPDQKAIGLAALNGQEYLEKSVIDLLPKNTSTHWEIQHDFTFGGYGKSNDELIRFMNQFKADHNMLLDPIYTGKMMFGLMQMIANDYFPKKAKIIAIHTGGLQGNIGMDFINQKKKL